MRKSKASHAPQSRTSSPAKPLIAPAPALPGTVGAVGVDVSKLTFHAAYQPGRGAPCKAAVFASDSCGQAKFLLWLQRVGAGQSCHICLAAVVNITGARVVRRTEQPHGDLRVAVAEQGLGPVCR